MKLVVYKGFDENFLAMVKEEPLVDNIIALKADVLKFDKKTRKQLDLALLSMDESDELWVSYEEYTLIKNRVDDAIEEDGLELVVFVNNLYPDYYPLEFDMSDELVNEIEKNLNSEFADDCSEECKRYLTIYNTLVNVNGTYYGSYYNYEYEKDSTIVSKPYYMNQILIEDSQVKTDIDIFINEDVDTYLRDLARIIDIKPSVIGLKMTDGLVSKRILLSLQAYCVANQIRLVKFHEQLEEDAKMEQELIDIAKNDIHISNFNGFRSIKFYKNPDIDKEIVEISQSILIQEIIHQAENSYNTEKGHAFRDIFITASTGAGKSVMFQVPAIYMAKHYHKLTIIIEPVKALMQDQKEKLIKNGYTRVEAFNSDLISQVEKETVLNRIKSGEVDLLYLSPETLLSYSIETIIGDREIGLLIIDEAHIVTTWGMGFRPDYWYLGGYINRLRNPIQTTAGKNRRIYKFPICAFTATAINGGVDDSVSDTIISLYMENPVKFIGYVRRDDIKFDIKMCESNKLHQVVYESQKTKEMSLRIEKWLAGKEKTIVYFPYAQNAFDASRGVRGFSGIKTDPRIGVFTGKNVDELNTETFNEKKRETFNKFRTGEQPVIYATKAFGMGVDIDDVKNVYHYAVSGNLCDYIQEIGRAARRPDMTGVAITDFFYNDMAYMNKLFGMSQIRQYQIKKVLEGIYDVYKSKKGARSFLISPQSFTYIFNGKGVKDEGQCINKLKTCLLMLEKDFYDKYNFKVKEAAKNFGEQGRKVLFLCFNKFLYADLKRKYPYTNVTYYNIHSFIKAYGNSTDDLSNSDKRAEILEGISWDDLDFDDVVIDEAQDFHDREIIYFKEFAELKDGRFFAFYDKNQVVQTDKVPEWIEKSECRLLLTKNCRNTYEIALTAYNVIDVELNQKIQMMNGEKTRLTFVQGNPMGKLVKLLRMLIGDKYGYDYSDIVILTLKTESESIMNNIVKISGIPITREKSNSSILFTTAKKFKGLESRVIIIVDIDEASFNDEKKKRNFYVACSRATQYLLLVVDGDDQKVKSIADCISGPNYAPKGKIAMKTQAALLNLD